MVPLVTCWCVFCLISLQSGGGEVSSDADLCVNAKYDKLLFLQALIRATRAVCQPIICPLAGATRPARLSPGCPRFPDRGAMKLWHRTHNQINPTIEGLVLIRPQPSRLIGFYCPPHTHRPTAALKLCRARTQPPIRLRRCASTLPQPSSHCHPTSGHHRSCTLVATATWLYATGGERGREHDGKW